MSHVPSLAWILAGATVAGTVLLLFAERRASPRLRYLAKPLASLGFILTALACGAAEHVLGRTLLLALLLSFAGDVALLSHERRWFLAGLGAFLAAHLAYSAAFVLRGVSLGATLTSLVLLVPLSAAVSAWLRPHTQGGMRTPVLAYIAAITAMVALAIGTVTAHGAPVLLAGALAFYLSDLSVARDRFVARSFWNRAWGLPLYYVAQLLFALGATPGT